MPRFRSRGHRLSRGLALPTFIGQSGVDGGRLSRLPSSSYRHRIAPYGPFFLYVNRARLVHLMVVYAVRVDSEFGQILLFLTRGSVPPQFDADRLPCGTPTGRLSPTLQGSCVAKLSSPKLLSPNGHTHLYTFTGYHSGRPGLSPAWSPR